MNEQVVMDLGMKTIWTAILVASPALLTVLFVGLLVSIFQAATQINEQTLSFIPKIVVMTIALAVCGPWIIQTMMEFTMQLFNDIPTIASK